MGRKYVAEQHNSTGNQWPPFPAVNPKVFWQVYEERKRQDDKWGEQNHPDPVWALILGEEFGELQKAILEAPDNVNPEAEVHDTREELIHVAAVALQWLEAIDRRVARESTPEAQQRRRTAQALFNLGPDA